jgi:hypothetical protein
MVPDLAPRPEDCLDVLQTTDAQRSQARLLGAADTDNTGDTPFVGRLIAEALTPEVETVKRRRAPLFRLRDHRRVHAPYLMVYAFLAYHALGHTTSDRLDRKAFRPFLFCLDAVLPAYPAPWDFRDRGLWFSRQSLLPLDEAVLASGSCMRPREMEAEAETAARPWLGRRDLLETDLRPSFLTARVVRSHAWWIFRPFHCVLADTPMGSGWFLVDGQFRTLAGYLDDVEAARVLARYWVPLDVKRFHRPEVRTFPCRCPVCAGTLTVDGRGTRQICPTCGRLLEPTPDGFRPHPYRLLERGGVPWKAPTTNRAAWLPFWRLEGAWSMEGSPPGSLEVLAAAVLPRPPRGAAPPDPAPRPLYLPAFDGWLYDQYDRWCLRASASLEGADPARLERRFHLEERLGEGDLLVPPSQDASLYASQLSGLAPSLLPPIMQARLNAAVVKRLAAVRFEESARELVFVPVPLGDFGDLPDRLLGPGCVVDAVPLATGKFPPALHRNIQRWKKKAEDAARKPAPDPPDPYTAFR